MSKADELKAKNENLFERNTILLNENERLKKENAELSMKRKAERKIFQGIVEKKNYQLNKAKEIIENCVCIINRLSPTTALLDKNERSVLEQAEQFLKEIEK